MTCLFLVSLDLALNIQLIFAVLVGLLLYYICTQLEKGEKWPHGPRSIHPQYEGK
jgi:hypothetical protein